MIFSRQVALQVHWVLRPAPRGTLRRPHLLHRTIKIVDFVADIFDVSYPETVARAGGSDVTTAPVVKDENGNPTAAPQGTEYKIFVTVRKPEAPHIQDGTEVETVKAGDDQPTTLDDTVVNPTEGMTGDVLDKDGNKIDGAEVTVDPDTGEITVKVPDTAKHGDAEVIIKDADGQPIDDPIEIKIDNSIDSTPSVPPIVKTTVDDSKVTPVKPTDDEQGTGVKVVNNDDDTKVSAKDEDGNDVPVTIDPDTGEVKVTPGEDVDGPITLTITDPDLKGGEKDGEVTIEVPVDSHTKGSDDNNSDSQSGGITDPKCYGTLLGFGVPMLALIPLGIAATVAIPGLEHITRPIQEQIQAANSELQKQFGLMNPQLAAEVARINEELRGVGANLVGVAAGLAILAAGVTAITITAINCAPGAGESGSSIKAEDRFRKPGEGSSFGSSVKREEVPAGTNPGESGSSRAGSSQPSVESDSAPESEVAEVDTPAEQ